MLTFFKKFIQEHFQSVKRFGSRSLPDHYRHNVGPDPPLKQFAKIISRYKNLLLASKESSDYQPGLQFWLVLLFCK